LNASHQINSLRNGSTGDVRYTKDQLLAVYKQQRDTGALDQNLPAIFTGGWNPLDGHESANPAWGRRDEAKESNVGPEICWDHDARAEPLALIQMSEEEREVRSLATRCLPSYKVDLNIAVFLIRQPTDQGAAECFQGTYWKCRVGPQDVDLHLPEQYGVS
jgi:hypothetical protein